MANVFSIKVTGMGDRFLQFRGSDSLDVQFVFANNQDAHEALDLIMGKAAEEKPYLYIDQAMADLKELQSAPKPKRKAGTATR